MFRLHPNDFQPLEQSQLKEILLGIDKTRLPSSIRTQIQVFRPEKAQAIEEKIFPGCQNISRYLFGEAIHDPLLIHPFQEIKRFRCSGMSVEDQRAITSWLGSLGIADDTIVLVSWETTLAATMTWHIFSRYWMEFWEDDLCMCTLDGNWYLLFYHEGIFLAGVVASPEQAMLIFQQKPSIRTLTEADQDEILQLILENKKIDAIKTYAKKSNLGLKDAKIAVNKLEKEHKSL